MRCESFRDLDRSTGTSAHVAAVAHLPPHGLPHQESALARCWALSAHAVRALAVGTDRFMVFSRAVGHRRARRLFADPLQDAVAHAQHDLAPLATRRRLTHAAWHLGAAPPPRSRRRARRVRRSPAAATDPPSQALVLNFRRLRQRSSNPYVYAHTSREVLRRWSARIARLAGGARPARRSPSRLAGPLSALVVSARTTPPATTARPAATR